jgi:hypothetical protein
VSTAQRFASTTPTLRPTVTPTATPTTMPAPTVTPASTPQPLAVAQPRFPSRRSWILVGVLVLGLGGLAVNSERRT